jgi:tRNA-dihydrouridine synthase B
MNFWKELKKPIVGLAPMDGITDPAMRFITKKYGNPDVIYTEFVSAEGLARKAKALFNDLRFDESERPIVAQLFGIDPESFREAAKIVVDLGFDGVDINMGCPAKNVIGRGGGASLIKNYPLAREIVLAVKEGVDGRIPVSVKTRVGYNEVDFDWIKRLAELDIAVIAVHGRTFRQGYGGRADWEVLGKMAKIVKESGKIFLGNGDVKKIKNQKSKIKDSNRVGPRYATQNTDFRIMVGDNWIDLPENIDGVLIGQAAMGNPWVFNVAQDVEMKEKVGVAIEHSIKFGELNQGNNFCPMRKHLAWYFRGFSEAASLRRALVMTNSSEEVIGLLSDSFG